MTTLDEFLRAAVPNLYIDYKDLEVYMRKGPLPVDDRVMKGLTIGAIQNRKRSDNIDFDPNHTRTGVLSEFEQLLRQKATELGYDGVYVECVHNEFLPDVLVRYGYKRVNIRGIGDYQEMNFWCSVENKHG